MKIREIQAGKKYWKTATPEQNSRSSAKARYSISIPVYVISVDLEKKQILCSINGGPAQFVNEEQCWKWKEKDPNKK